MPVSTECAAALLSFRYPSIYFVCWTINAAINTLTKRLRRDEKVLILSSSVVCLSFTILNIFKNEKGILKILFCSSVFDL